MSASLVHGSGTSLIPSRRLLIKPAFSCWGYDGPCLVQAVVGRALRGACGIVGWVALLFLRHPRRLRRQVGSASYALDLQPTLPASGVSIIVVLDTRYVRGLQVNYRRVPEQGAGGRVAQAFT